MKLSPQKSQVVVFTKKINYTNPIFALYDQNLEVVSSFKFLGIHLDLH